MIHEIRTSGQARFSAFATGSTWTVSPMALNITMHTLLTGPFSEDVMIPSLRRANGISRR